MIIKSVTFIRNFSRFSRAFNMYKHKQSSGIVVNNARVVDLRSDTLSKPSREMRQAIFEAEVGDDVLEEDPTVIALQQTAAQMLGKESALFVASGTMGNLIAILTHCDKRGSELITGDNSHTFLYEQGGPAQLGGVHTCTIPNLPDGTFSIEEMEKRVRPDDLHYPTTSLICVENTHNMCGGKVLPLDWLDKLGAKAKSLGIPIHMDGARLFNASVHLGIPPSRIVRDCATVSFCLSKSLGAPIGSILVGSNDFIARARRTRKVVGGGMRQVGIIAAAGLYSLDHMVDRLKDDHDRIAKIAKAIDDMNSPAMKVDFKNLHTNILMVNVNPKILTAQQLTERMATLEENEAKELGDLASIVKISPKNDEVVRLVVYCDIDDDDISAVIRKFQWINSEYTKQ